MFTLLPIPNRKEVFNKKKKNCFQTGCLWCLLFLATINIHRVILNSSFSFPEKITSFFFLFLRSPKNLCLSYVTRALTKTKRKGSGTEVAIESREEVGKCERKVNEVVKKSNLIQERGNGESSEK